MLDGLLVELMATCELLYYMGNSIMNDNIPFKITLLGELPRLLHEQLLVGVLAPLDISASVLPDGHCCFGSQ